MSDYARSRHGEGGDGFFCRFTFGQFFALLVLEVFTLFFVFYLGARYGRDFLGLEERPAVVEGTVAEEATVITTGDPEAARMADELIATAKTPELKERIRNMIQGAQQGEERRIPEVVAVNRREESPAPPAAPEPTPDRPVEVASTQPPAAPAEPAKPEGSTDTNVIRVKSPGNARYSVQVGSYPQMEEAARTVDRWKKKGYPAFMMIADIPDRGRWYRVRLGGFESRNEATRYMQELQSREDVEALVVLNEQ